MVSRHRNGRFLQVSLAVMKWDLEMISAVAGNRDLS